MFNEALTAGLIFIGGILITTMDKNKEESANCLALNMYYESRNQGTVGILGVTAVVYNRVNDKRFPNTICEVIKQGPIRASWKGNGTFFPIKNKCQFSWWCDGKSDKPKNKNIILARDHGGPWQTRVQKLFLLCLDL